MSKERSTAVVIKEEKPPFALDANSKGALKKLAHANRTGLGRVVHKQPSATKSTTKQEDEPKRIRIAAPAKSSHSAGGFRDAKNLKNEISLSKPSYKLRNATSEKLLHSKKNPL